MGKNNELEVDGHLRLIAKIMSLIRHAASSLLKNIEATQTKEDITSSMPMKPI